MENNSVDITKEVKRAEKREKWRGRFQKVQEWWDDNKQYVIVGAPVAAGLLGKGIQVLGKRHNLKLEERNKDLRCYDASLGHYWELKRKLTNDDWVKINRRKNNGEALGDILTELRVLK